MELLDGTLIEDGLAFGVLEELIDGLGDQPDRQIVMPMVTEHGFKKRQTRSILHDVACLIDVEHDLCVRYLRSLVHQRDEQLHRQRRAAVHASLLLGEIKVDDLLVVDVEVRRLTEIGVATAPSKGRS